MTDEISRRPDLVGLSFIDFFEAIARIATMKPLPTAAMLARLDCSASSFYALKEALELEPLDRMVPSHSLDLSSPPLALYDHPYVVVRYRIVRMYRPPILLLFPERREVGEVLVV